MAHLSHRRPDVPVVPVFLHGLGKALPKGESVLVPFFCDVFIGEAMTWTGDRTSFMTALASAHQRARRRGEVSAMGMNLVALLWAVAEATLFFVVPDVWLTVVAARRGIRKALVACGFAVLGALLGGTIMYLWASADPAAAIATVGHVPGIPPGMMDNAAAALRAQGVLAMVFGAFAGVPYKIYAVEAPGAGIGLALFLAMSVPARLMRFVLLSGMAAAFAGLVDGWLSKRVVLGVVVARGSRSMPAIGGWWVSKQANCRSRRACFEMHRCGCSSA